MNLSGASTCIVIPAEWTTLITKMPEECEGEHKRPREINRTRENELWKLAMVCDTCFSRWDDWETVRKNL
jgi:hypothetical protein